MHLVALNTAGIHKTHRATYLRSTVVYPCPHLVLLIRLSPHITLLPFIITCKLPRFQRPSRLVKGDRSFTLLNFPFPSSLFLLFSSLVSVLKIFHLYLFFSYPFSLAHRVAGTSRSSCNGHTLT